MIRNLRIILVLIAMFLLVIVARKIKKAQFDSHGTLFWLSLSVMLILDEAFPRLVHFASALLGFQSPSNFVFLMVIAIFLWRLLRFQQCVASLHRKLTTVTQEIALQGHEREG